MAKTYYISEVAVSDRHGSGITLQKVLGEDLLDFDQFIHLSPNATEVYPVAEHLKNRQLNLHKIFPFPPNPIKFSPRYFLIKLAQIAKINWILSASDKSQIRKFAGYLEKNIEIADSKWLVLPQGRFAIETVNQLYRQSPFNYITWMMDDQMVRKKEGNWYYPADFEKAFQLHLRQARKVLAISQEMADFYDRRFGIKAQVIFSPADPLSSESIENELTNHNGYFRFCYFGAVRPWQQDALEYFSKSLFSLEAYLDIYSFDSLPTSLLHERVNRREPVPIEQVPGLMKQYDAVIIPISFKDELRNLSELNIATKLSECLASGTVTIIVGPEYAAMTQFIRKYGGGLIVDVTDSKSFIQLKQLKNTSFREVLIKQAHQITQEITSTNAMRNIWRQIWDK